MKKIIFLLSLLISINTFAVCPEFILPSKFKAREQIINIGTDMTLSDPNGRFGEIQERLLRVSPTFELYNIGQEKVATAFKKFFSWGTTIDVWDCEKKLIGTVKENIIVSLTGFYTRYDVLDANGMIIGATEKKEFFTTNFTVLSNEGEKIMTIKRPALSLGFDMWTVEVFNDSVIDPRIITMIPAFKTSADNHKKKEND